MKEPLHLAKIVEESFTKEWGRREKPPNVFSPSTLGYCKRQMYNKKAGLTKFDRYIKGIVHCGTRHHYWLEHHLPSMIEDRGLRTEVKFRKKVGDIYLNGIIDAVDSEGYVYDHKFTGAVSYVKKEPKLEHVIQILAYIIGIDAEAGVVEYIGRDGKFQDGDYVQHVIKFEDYAEVWKDVISDAEEVANYIIENGYTENPYDKCERDDGNPCFYCKSENLRDSDGE